MSSATGSATFKLPPDHASPTSAHISHIFGFDPFRQIYQHAEVLADGQLLWIDVQDTSIIADLEQMRHLLGSPRIREINIDHDRMEITFDQHLHSSEAEWKVQNQTHMSSGMVHFDRLQLDIGSSAPIFEMTLPESDRLTSEFGHSLSANTLLFSDEDDVRIDASSKNEDVYIWALGNNATLIGGSGADVLVSNTGVGGEIKTGGQGADLFVWQPVGELRNGAVSTVTDFDRADGDQLDLSNVFDSLDVNSEIEKFFKIDIENNDAYLRFDIDRSGTFDSVYSIHLENAYLNKSITMEDSLSSLYLNQSIIV